MSLKYFIGNNLGPKTQNGDTALTSLGLPETEPSAAEGGKTAKGQGQGTVYTRARKKVYTKTTDTAHKNWSPGAANITKTRASRLHGGKYNFGHMWRYRKVLKRLLDGTTGTTANQGVRNMYISKGAGHTGTKHSKAASGQKCQYPMSSAK